MKYFETLRYRVNPANLKDVVFALLVQQGFDGFLEEEEGWVLASRPFNHSENERIESIIKALPASLEWTSQQIPEQNWNLTWEQSFPVVDIGDSIRILAPFHTKGSGKEEFELEPNMAFGTGHHPTTYLMVEALSTRSRGKICLDFGTGTGILTMVMLRFGAIQVTATDNDERAIQSAERNIRGEIADLSAVKLNCTADIPDGEFDLIAANIHLNVIVEKLPELFNRLKTDGQILVSGILEHQEKPLLQAASERGFISTFKQSKEGWICLALEKMK